MPNTKREWAEYLTTALGLKTFPLVWTDKEGNCSCGDKSCKSSGKHPLPGSNGFKDASLEPKRIREWWTEYPEANIGLPMGENHIAVDLDMKKGKDGIAALAEFLRVDEWDINDITLTSRTTTGGMHLIFKTDTPFGDKVNVLSGVDIRGQGGYIVGPGSVIGETAYEIINDVPIAPVTDGIKSILKVVKERDEHAHKPIFELDHPAAIEQAIRFLKLREPAIEGQGGNEHTYVTACKVKDCGVSEGSCLSLMLEHFNEKCVPPWDTKELKSVVRNAYQYGKDRPGSKDQSLLDRIEYVPDLEGETIDNGPDPAASIRGNHLRLDKLWESDREYNFIIPNVIPAQGYTCVLAARGVGKSTWIIDVCMRLIHDMDWYDVPMDKGWTVVYIVGEDLEGVRARTIAWKEKYGKGTDTDYERWHTFDMAVDLTNAGKVQQFAEYVVKEIRRKGLQDRKVLFVLDTWQRMTSSAEGQSNDGDMQQAVAHVEALARSFNGPGLIAFHPPKNNAYTIMGSSVIENSSQAIVHIEEKGNGYRQMRVTRCKGADMEVTMDMRFESMMIGGQDAFGKDRKGPVVVKTGGTGMEMSPEEFKRQLDTYKLIADTVYRMNNFNPHFTGKVSPLKVAEAWFEAHNVRDNPAAEAWVKKCAELGIKTDTLAGTVRDNAVYKGLVAPMCNRIGPDGYDLKNGRYLCLEKKGTSRSLYIREVPIDTGGIQCDEDGVILEENDVIP